MQDNTTDKPSSKLLHLTDSKGQKVEGILQLAVEKKARLYQGYFTSSGQDRHLIKALSVGAYRLNTLLRCLMSKGNWITVSQKTLMQELGISNRTIIKYMAELKRLDVIRGAYGHYMYNPRIAINGGSRVLAKAAQDYHRILWVVKDEA